EAITVDYSPLPVVADMAAAVAKGSPLVWDAATGNIAAEMRHGDPEATNKAFASAAHVVSVDLDNQRVIPNPIEPRATLASFDSATGRTTLTVSCQTPTGLRDELCGALDIPIESVRVVVGDVGGGFGMKTALYAEDVIAAFATKMLK